MRIFLPDYNHEAIACFLRREAFKGFQRGEDDASRRYTEACIVGVNLPEHPNSVSLVLTRDMVPGCLVGWHLSICCVTERGYRGYASEEGEYWKRLIFGPHADRALERPLEERTHWGIEKDVRHFILECDWSNHQDPACGLAGLEFGGRVPE